MKKYIALIAFALSGCVSTDMLYVDENGKQVYQTICNWNNKTIGDCFKGAGKVCPNGFNIIERHEGSMFNGVSTFGDITGSTQSTANINGNFYGNAFNAFGNAISNTNISMNSTSTQNTVWERYIIYTCK